VNITWEGANYVLIQQTARYILKNIQNILKGKPVEASSMSFLTIDPEVVRTAKAPFAVAADLRDKPETLQTILKYRVNYLVQRCIIKLQDTVQRSADSLEAWNESQVHYLQNLGFAYGDLFFAELFLQKCKEVRAACQETSAMLMRLYELFVLSKIEEDLCTFRDNDYISTDQAWVIKETVIALTHEVGESAVRLIDAVAFPDQIVGSVLGNSDGQIYRHLGEAVENGPEVTDKPAYMELFQQLRKIKE
jgi:acyl-CoA oxidase